MISLSERPPTPNPNEPFDTAARTYALHHVNDYLSRMPELSPEVAGNLVRLAAIEDHKDLAFQVEAAAAAEHETRSRGGSR